eukprot:gene11271-9813_t
MAGPKARTLETDCVLATPTAGDAFNGFSETYLATLPQPDGND